MNTITINAKRIILVVLSIILLITFGGFILGTARAADNSTDAQTTNYGTVNWSTAKQGYITFTASSSSGQERVFILQGPTGKQMFFTVAENTTINIDLTDGIGGYQYAIAHSSDGKYFYIDYKNSFPVNQIDTAFAP